MEFNNSAVGIIFGLDLVTLNEALVGSFLNLRNPGVVLATGPFVETAAASSAGGTGSWSNCCGC